MLIKRRKGWEMREAAVTPEALAIGRRAALAGMTGLAIGARALPAWADDAAKYPPGRATTAEADATTYNNFYEFGTDKSYLAGGPAPAGQPMANRVRRDGR